MVLPAPLPGPPSMSVPGAQAAPSGTPSQVIIGRLLLGVEAACGAFFLLFLGLAVGLNDGLGDGIVPMSIGQTTSATAAVLLAAPLVLLLVSLIRSAAVPWIVAPLQLVLAIGVTAYEVNYQPGVGEPNIQVGWASLFLVLVAAASAWCFLSPRGRRHYLRSAP